MQLVKEKGFEVAEYNYPVDYAHYSADEVLRRLLPEGMEASAHILVAAAAPADD